MCYIWKITVSYYNSEMSYSLMKWYLGDDIGESRVTQQQPTTGSDSVGFVLELFGVHLIEIMEPTGQID
jgi:hypothetical protein